VIAGWAARSGVEVINPGLSIKTLHVHGVDDRPSDRLSMNGFYAYPHLTTMNTTGEVLGHDWPRKDGAWEFDWQLLRYEK
jgi:hypothetical protein